MVITNNLIIKTLAMLFAVISIVVILFVALIGSIIYTLLWLVGALSVLTVSVYQWWVRVLTGVKEVGRADHD